MGQFGGGVITRGDAGRARQPALIIQDVYRPDGGAPSRPRREQAPGRSDAPGRRPGHSGMRAGTGRPVDAAGVRSHVAMDPGQRSLAGGAGLRALREAGVAGMVEFHERKSQVVLPELLAHDRVFDLAFIDGDHRFDAAFLDLYYLHRLVKPGGLIVVDNVWMPSARLAVSYFHHQRRPGGRALALPRCPVQTRVLGLAWAHIQPSQGSSGRTAMPRRAPAPAVVWPLRAVRRRRSRPRPGACRSRPRGAGPAVGRPCPSAGPPPPRPLTRRRLRQC